MGNTGSDMYDAGLHFIGQSPVTWPQLMKKATCKCQKEKKVNLVITEFFVFAIKGNGRERLWTKARRQLRRILENKYEGNSGYGGCKKIGQDYYQIQFKSHNDALVW